MSSIESTLDDYRWLTGDEAASELAALGQATASPLGTSKSLRRRFPPERVRLLVEQTELRRRAAKKFDAADRMYFTARSLQQATDQQIAAYKARRFEGFARVGDLCCGIGGDLLALAAREANERFQTTGIDIDPVMTLLATANCLAVEIHASVRTGAAAAVDPCQFDAWHIDPDRRPGGRRTTQIATYSPNLEILNGLLQNSANAAIKLAPASVAPEDWQNESELEWISRDRECRQQVAWLGQLADESARGKRRATIVGAHSQTTSFVGRPDQPIQQAAAIGRYLFEPDPAVLASGLGGAVAAEYQLAALAPDIAYFTADQPHCGPLMSCFEVTDVMPLDVRRVRQLVKARGIGRLEIKKRGVPHDPEDLRRRLRPRGEASATLLLTRFDGRAIAILARRKWLESSL